MMHIFNSAYGDICLSRMPSPAKDQHQAWDSADQYLLQHCKDKMLLDSNSRVLTINDQFGALTCALAKWDTAHIDCWSDSHISHLATAENLSQNNLKPSIDFIPSTQALESLYDLILIKLPKTTALLETQLNGLGKHLNPNARIIAAGMCKHMPTSTYSIFEKHIGKTTTSLAIKKARLIFSENNNIDKIQLPYPIVYHQDDIDLTLSNHANVFSKEQLDIGARFFIEHFEKLPKSDSIIDLGCGNGVLGIKAKTMGKADHIHFVDESYMAVASAKTNYLAALSDQAGASYHLSESLSQLATLKADIVLCNPPFHQQHQVGEFIAKRMFKQSLNSLNNQGELWVVANRHLNYYSYLKRLFSRCDTVASNNKFNLYRAAKQH